MTDLTTYVQKYPWEIDPAAPTLEETVEALRRDFAYAVQLTAVKVHSNNPALAIIVNTDRGQIVPRGQCRFKDGTFVEFQDIGMCQRDTPYMTVPALVTAVWQTATDLGLEFQS